MVEYGKISKIAITTVSLATRYNKSQSIAIKSNDYVSQLIKCMIYYQRHQFYRLLNNVFIIVNRKQLLVIRENICMPKSKMILKKKNNR